MYVIACTNILGIRITFKTILIVQTVKASKLTQG